MLDCQNLEEVGKKINKLYIQVLEYYASVITGNESLRHGDTWKNSKLYYWVKNSKQKIPGPENMTQSSKTETLCVLKLWVQ